MTSVMERGVLLCRATELDVGDLPRAISGLGATDPAGGPLPDLAELWERPLLEARAELTEAFEREYLRRVLESSAGQIGEAAGRAGLDPRTLYNKMRRYGLKKEAFRS